MVPRNIAVLIMVILCMLTFPAFKVQALESIPEPKTINSREIKNNTINNIVKNESPKIEPKPVIKNKYYKKCKVTAYCSCSKCCGQYANNRPLDKYGKEIVYTASGKIAKNNYTCAAGLNLPFGTILLIDGKEYIVEDRGSKVSNSVIDIYFDSHEAALQWGCKYLDIYIVEKE